MDPEIGLDLHRNSMESGVCGPADREELQHHVLPDNVSEEFDLQDGHRDESPAAGNGDPIQYYGPEAVHDVSDSDHDDIPDTGGTSQ